MATRTRYLSLFSGIGGFELGINRSLPSAECIGYSEIDKPAIKTYEEHFEHHNYGDITAINPAELPDFELIVGGFPCQAFSLAGKRRGFEDARGTLFFDVARILKHKRPGHLVLENVKGLFSHDDGKTFQTILGILSELGYDVEWQLLNSKDWGVPQNRERVYIVGHLAGRCERKVLPIGRYEEVFSQTRSKAKSKNEFSNTIRAKSGGGRGDIEETYVIVQRPRGKNKGGSFGIAPTLTSLSYQYNNHVVGRGSSPDLILDQNVRRLTPVEFERLQGFPDNWTIGSDTQRYKQCGNAVTVNVVAEVIDALRLCLVH